NRQLNSDLRQVGVTVSVTLQADLHNSDDRQQHNQIPQPADEQVRTLSAKSECTSRDRNDKGGRERDLPKRKRIFGMRIKSGEISWRDQLPQVDDVADDSILQSPAKRQLRDRTHRVLLQNKSDNRGSERQSEE